MSEYALQPTSTYGSTTYRKLSDPELDVPTTTRRSWTIWRVQYPAMPHAVSSRLKSWRRKLLDLNVELPRRFQGVSRAISPRQAKQNRWIALPVVLVVILFLLLRGWKGNGSQNADARHLDSLVSRIGHLGIRNDEQVPLGSINALKGTKKKQVGSSDEGDDTDGHHQTDGTFEKLHAIQDGDHDDHDNDDDEEPDTAIPMQDDNGRSIPDYREIFSLTTRDRKYFLLWFDGEPAYNPNLIPHPTLANKWIVVAQREHFSQATPPNNAEQLVCVAAFLMGVLVCEEHPTVLPVAPSIRGNCVGHLELANLRTGPHDGRLFYGPGEPYFMYGSQSSFACFGLWLQDARMLLEPYRLEQSRVGLFRSALELHRPEPWHEIEKNFFLFWDSRGVVYVHHDIWPNRVFAQLEFNGAVGPDIAPLAAINDSRCMGSFMPNANKQLESIHQATNALSITLCKRRDSRCVPSDDNTFIMHIFQHKTFYEFHAVYEPYLMLFRRNAPFEIHAISQRPFWIHGRTDLTEATNSAHYRTNPQQIPIGHTESLYVTSMSWQNHKQRYHGYIDDVIFLAFGVEDARSGVIDVEAESLLQDLAYCELAMPD